MIVYPPPIPEIDVAAILAAHTERRELLQSEARRGLLEASRLRHAGLVTDAATRTHERLCQEALVIVRQLERELN